MRIINVRTDIQSQKNIAESVHVKQEIHEAAKVDEIQRSAVTDGETAEKAEKTQKKKNTKDIRGNKNRVSSEA